jgi:exodeoxyribonuclease VII large subunit
MEYPIALLNKTLSEVLDDSISNFPKIELKGEIIDCKIFKNNCGISFRIRDEFDNQFLCKAWASKGISIRNIKDNENTNCIIKGIIKQSYFNCRYEFILDLEEDLINENNISKIKTLRNYCEVNGLFLNKKEINWNSIKSIGLISKRDTQGYNDFITQLKVPLVITLKEIALEGDGTSNEVIKAIEEFQEFKLDFIIIIRGGGSTIDISNSFDKIELFQAIKISRIPIITAIGHEADKDDKLLITSVSDYDFPTPTRASLDLNLKITKPIINKLKVLESKVNISYKEIYINLFDKLHKEYFKTPIIKIKDDDEFILIEKNGKFYKIKLNLSDEIIITNDELKEKEMVEKAIKNYDLDTIKNFIDKDNEIIKEIEMIKQMELNEINLYQSRIQILEELTNITKIREIFIYYQ